MTPRSSPALLVVFLFLLGGCAWWPSAPPLSRSLGPNWDPGDSWTVRVQYWPDRLQNPGSRSGSTVVRELKYTVLKPDANRYRVLVEDQTTREQYILTFNDSYNLLRVKEVLSRRRPGVWKTRELIANSWSDRVLFPRGWTPSTARFWYHPDLAVPYSPGDGTSILTRRYGSPTEEPLVQRVRPREDGYVLELLDRSTRTGVRFLWPRGEDWWSRARWYRDMRLVAQAERISS